MDSRSFSQYVEQTFGKPVHFCIYAVLEWIMIIMLFIDGVISFAANEFAHFFDLKIPCLLCTRIDHVLAQRGSDYYYNDSICEHHQKDISSLAYCHIHRKLSDVRYMCEGCLLSFATENKSNSDTYKSLVGVLGSNLECSVEDDHKIHLKLPAKAKDGGQVEKSAKHRCYCCGDPRKVKAPLSQKLVQNPVMKADNLPQAPAPSPRGLVLTKGDEFQSFDQLSHVQYSELKYMSDTESEIPEDDDKSTALIALDSQVKEDTKAATVPLLPDCDDSNEDSACRTPSFVRLNKFFGIAYSDSANASPRWLQRIPKRFPAEKVESGAESLEGNSASETEGETILHHLKRQVRLDRKTLIAMYMELDEERSASAVAANQALAMITRLQAEKAAMQMEALQYQRMMEEQAEYDQEALQVMKDMLNKREEEIKILQEELKVAYRGRSEYEVEISDDNYQTFSFRCNSFASGKSDCGSTHANIEVEVENGAECESNSAQTGPSPLGNPWNTVDESLDFEGERLYLLDQVRILEEKINSSSNAGVGSDSINPKEEERGERGTTDVIREISHLYEKLLALETDREFLKRAFRSLQKGEEGTQLLKEIAQHLRDLRQKESMPSQC